MRPPARAALLGVFFAALVTLPGLGSGTLWDNSETAYGEVAREILLTGDWVVMHLNGLPWFVQPPLYFWLAAGFAKVFGVAPFALRLPSALATIAMSGALGYGVARVAGVRAGTLAAAVLATSLMQAVVGRLAIMDALLDACVLLAILCWYRAFASPGGGPAFVGGAAALAFGTLAKGPVAPVIVVLVIGVWLLWERRAGVAIALPSRAALASAAGVFAVIVVRWFLAVSARAGAQAAAELVGHYTIGRYTGVIENQRGPLYYYVPVLILGFFPWIAFAPVAFDRAVREARARDGSTARLALVWTIVPLVFFSLAQTKLPNYVALLLPALAILVARWFDAAADGAGRCAGLFSAASIPLFIGAVAVAIAAFSRTNQLDVGAVLPLLAVLGSGMLVGALLTVLALALRRTRWAPYILGASSAAMMLFIALVAEPAAERLKPIPRVARAIAAQRAPGAVVAIRSIGGTNGLAFYTTPGIVTIDDTEPAFARLICTTADVYVVTRSVDRERLEALARTRGRRAADLGDDHRVTAVHVDGPPCGATAPNASGSDGGVPAPNPRVR